MALPPGPKLPMPLQSARLHRDPLGFLRDGQRRYGDVYTIRLFVAGSVVVVADPAALKDIFMGDEEVYRGGEGQQMIELMVGPSSIFLADGAEHAWKRKVMLPPFHRTAIQRYADRIRQITQEQIASWEIGTAMPIHPKTRSIAMEVICQIIFGLEDPAEIAELRRKLVLMRDPLHPLIMFPWLRRPLGRWSPWSVFTRRRGEVDDIVYGLIARRRAAANLEDQVDMLSLLIQATDEEGKGLSDTEIRDQLLSMVLAGYETTATGLAWTVQLLGRHPHVFDRVRETLDSGDERYLEAVVHEGLRLYPPLFHVARLLSEPVKVGGYEIPAGTNLMLAILLLHRRDDVYPQADSFLPERFLEERPHRDTWVPFGTGPRLCLGSHLAQLEMRIVLDEIVRNLDIQPASPKPENIRLFHITLVPQHGAKVVLTRRKPALTPAAP